MAFPRKRRAAFTLTEMLMAAGILGLGLTMVASIFPVAVDQSRRSRDQTMAALCARSIAARLRMSHNVTLTTMRGRKWGDSPEWKALYSQDMVYAPSEFLYDGSRSYGGVGVWSAGHYAARIYTSRTTAAGPHRLTIAVCRTTGPGSEATYMEQWKNAPANFPPKPGAYAINYQKEWVMGYLIEYVDANSRNGYLAVKYSCPGSGLINSETQGTAWGLIRDASHSDTAVAVYHTFLGE